MPATNTATRYGSVARSLHWATALGIFLAIPLGIIANGLPFETSEQLARKALLFSLHKTVGITVLALALARIAWALTQPKPAALHPDRKAEHFLAETVHWLLYGSLVLVPLSGWVHHAATDGFAPIWWPLGQSLPFVPKSVALAETAASLHIIFERVLVLSLLLHIAGALKHHFVDKDATLRRMTSGVEAGIPTTRQTRAAPAGFAVVVWTAALGIGAGLGLFSHDARAARPALAQVASDWTVQSGSLNLTISQFGSDVSGGFEDWTAAITFDETATTAPLGDVDVTVSIPSLTLGSVTDQALGADFFDAAQFATATYTGDILPEDGDNLYRLSGTLTIKSIEMPLDIPFTLTLDGDTAVAEGQAVIDRRRFGIGDSMTDESQLGFSVTVALSLTATRTP